MPNGPTDRMTRSRLARRRVVQGSSVEDFYAPKRLMLEDGTFLLQEDGDYLLLENTGPGTDSYLVDENGNFFVDELGNYLST